MVLLFYLLIQIIKLAQSAQFCNTTNCYTCYYHCQSCVGPQLNQCTSCLQNYILNVSTCQPCAANCISCVTASDGSYRCQACSPMFYLSQSTGQCNLCPTGAQICTFSAVQQCQSGFYLQYSICFYCISNCRDCSNAYSCTACQDGYTLTSQGICTPCLVNKCLTCDETNTCSLCKSGYYGQFCQSICQSFCQICDNNNCYQCQPGYYLTSDRNCQAASILCSTGSGPGQCNTCISQASLIDNVCVPYSSFHLYNELLFFHALNNNNSFALTSLVLCASPFQFIFQEGTDLICLQIVVRPSYKLQILYQIITVVNSQLVSISLSSVNLIQQFKGNITSKYGYQCGGRSYVLSNFKSNFTPYFDQVSSSYAIVLNFKQQSGGFIGISQVLVEQYLCRVDNCGICFTAFTCFQCQQLFLLQNNQCVTECSSGYYLTPALSTCSLSCPSTYYPILSDYSCSKCLSPCQICSAQTKCTKCLTGWFLYSFNCFQNCPAGYYQNITSHQCQSCRYPCKNCFLTENTCSICSLGYLNKLNNTCSMTCPNGFYQNFTTISCQLCDTSCLACQFSPILCISCQSPLFLNPNGTCLSTCDSNYAANLQTNTCQKCIYPCKTCNINSSFCLQCFTGYLLNGICQLTCPIGYYNGFLSKQCQSCDIRCSSCLSDIQCLSCSANYYFYPEKQLCLLVCPNSTYVNNITQQCTPCQSPCNQCLGQTQCLSCIGYLFVFHNYQCLLGCPASTYMTLNQSTHQKNCIPCGNLCSSCLSVIQCLTCVNSSLSNGSCVTLCPSLTYSFAGQCLACSFPCKQCSSSDLCTSCQIDYFHYNITSSCLRICPNGYYANSLNSSCQICSNGCSVCRSSTICLVCSENSYMNNNSQCVTNCQSGYYPYPPQGICKLCSTVCLQCIHGNLCLSCRSMSMYPYFFKYSCVSSCPYGYFVNSNSICELCSSQCLTCLNIAQNCTSCADGLYYFPNSSVNLCISDCPLNYYPNPMSICLKCISPCKTCHSQIHCTSCLQINQNLYSGRCISACPIHYYSYNGTCLICDSNCLQCSVNSNNCTNCGPDHFLIINNNTPAVCSANCPDGTYSDSITQSCLKCQTPCKFCYSTSRCINCQIGYYLQFDLCLLSCLEGYFSNNLTTSCQLCQSPCLSCKNQHQCLSCQKGFFYQQISGNCLSACPLQTYAFQTSNGDMQCLGCPSTCLECYDYSACKSCNSSSARPYHQGTSCQSNCTNGYFINNGTWMCEWCGYGCLQCQQPTKCQKCVDSYLYEGVCQIQCPIGYYQSLTFTCEVCISPCFQCYDSANCQYCIPGYYLYLTHCLEQCPIQQWAVSSLGVCNQTCLPPFFQVRQSRLCVNSCDIYYDQNGNCVQTCDSEMMANESLGCQSCLTANCQLKLQFQLQQQQINGQFILLIIFNREVDNMALFSPKTFDIQLGPASSISQKQLQISGLRHLQTNQINPKYISQMSKTADALLIKIDFSQLQQDFSGNLIVSVADLNVFTASDYPLQMTKSSIYIEWYHSADSQNIASTLGLLGSAVYLLLLICNFLMDTTRSILPLIDGIQNLHFIFYLNVWYHPLLQNYLYGLRFTSFKISFQIFQTSHLWNCAPKYILTYGYCNPIAQIILPCLCIVFMCVIAIICRLFKIFENKHRFVWNHIYDIFWITGLSLGVTAFRYLLYYISTLELLISLLIAFLFLLTSFILSYQIVRNVYSGGFNERCFFWGLWKQKCQQPLANLHPVLLLMRRVSMAMAIGLAEDRSLSCLFILALLTICIISNIVINKALRKNSISLTISQILFAVLLFMLQMYIVNAAKMQNQTWNAYGIFLFIIVIIYSLLLFGTSVRQTYRGIVKFYRKCTKKDCQNQQKSKSKKSLQNEQKISEKSSNKSKKQIKQNKSSENQSQSSQSASQNIFERREQQNQISDETQHQFIRMNSDLFSPKSGVNSEPFSQGFCGVSQFQKKQHQADKILIKIAKKNNQQLKNN